MGRTNQLRSVMKHIGSRKVYLFDSKKGDLQDYSQKNQVVYSGNQELALENIEKLKSELESRKEQYVEAKIDNAALRIQDFVKEMEPCYIVIDIIQELYELLAEQKRETELDCINEAVQWGIYTVVTSDAGMFRDQRNKLLITLKGSKEGIVVGNLKSQSIFPSTGIRENNTKKEFGYYFQSGKSGRIKFIEN